MGLAEFFTQNPRAALAFSGGVDSAYLLWAGIAQGAEVQPYFADTAFQHRSELAGAEKLAARLGVRLKILRLDILSYPEVVSNPPDRCYHCKRAMLGQIKAAAGHDGFSLVLDGTNAGDNPADRPGMKALAELSVRSPLRECGLGKADIRALSKQAGLFTWDKPACSCLATRIPAGTVIAQDKLSLIERAETKLAALGFCDFRVRWCGGLARVQVSESQWEKAAGMRQTLKGALEGFRGVLLDTETR